MQLLSRQIDGLVEALLVWNPDIPFAQEPVFGAVPEANANAVGARRGIDCALDGLNLNFRSVALTHLTSSLVRFAPTKVAAWAGRASDGCGSPAFACGSAR